MRLFRVVAVAVLGCACGLGGFLAHAAQETRFKSQTGVELRLLLGPADLKSSEVELAEITFPPGADSGDHVHGATEVFYVLAGELEHIVNGRSTLLKPGMVGFVKPPDSVRHKTGPGEPVKALVIWAPGGEAARIVARWQAVK